MASGKNSHSLQHNHNHSHTHDNTEERPKAAQRATQSYHDEEDEDSASGLSTGLREVVVRRRAHNENRLPLRKAEDALRETFAVANQKHSDALAYIDEKVKRAMTQGLFSIKFTFGEVEGLCASSHGEYVAFIQLLDILGYTAKYANTNTNDGERREKEIFLPQTIIFLDWLPRKK